MRLLLTVFAVSAFAGKCLFVGGSEGDRSEDFKSCLQLCLRQQCSYYGPDKDPSANYITLAWTCPDTCRYECMWNTVAKRKQAGKPTCQFYGKWPFWRVLGMQEAGSVVASLANLGVHVAGVLRFHKKCSEIAVPHSQHLRLIIYSVAGMAIAAWLAAALYHARDRWWTERADYAMASASIAWNTVVYSSVRMLHLDGWQSLYALIAWFLALYHHFRYQLEKNVFNNPVESNPFFPTVFLLRRYLWTKEHFDYTYNMAASVAVSTVFVLVWLLWCLHHVIFRSKGYVFFGEKSYILLVF